MLRGANDEAVSLTKQRYQAGSNVNARPSVSIAARVQSGTGSSVQSAFGVAQHNDSSWEPVLQVSTMSAAGLLNDHVIFTTFHEPHCRRIENLARCAPLSLRSAETPVLLQSRRAVL